jgi:hypothetical protein
LVVAFTLVDFGVVLVLTTVWVAVELVAAIAPVLIMASAAKAAIVFLSISHLSRPEWTKR